MTDYSQPSTARFRPGDRVRLNSSAGAYSAGTVTTAPAHARPRAAIAPWVYVSWDCAPNRVVRVLECCLRHRENRNEGNAMTHWYRDTKRGRFHAERADWVQSGKALCGATIKDPSFVKIQDAYVDRTLCRHCVHILSTRKVTP